MRIRGTKPEFWRSKRIASVDWEPRLLLKGLESYVDDNGVGKDDIELIVGDLFQRDLVREPSRTLARVAEGLSALHEAGLIHRYEFEGTCLLYISFWESVQRVDKPQQGRFPRPDGTLNYKDSLIREPSRTLAKSPLSLAPVTGEQGNRGTGEQESDITPVNETTYVRESSESDWEEAAHEVGIQSLDEVRTVLSSILDRNLTSFEALVFAQEFAKIAHPDRPVTNLGAYIIAASVNSPKRIRQFDNSIDLGVTA